MKRVLFFILGVAFLTSVVLFAAGAVSAADEKAATAGDNPQVVKIIVNNKEDVSKLADSGFDLAEVKTKKKYVIAVLSEKNIKQLKGMGYVYKVVNADANSLFRFTRAGKYHSFEQVEQLMKDAETNYPDICKVSVIGKSFEGRPIYALNITGKSSAKKPAALFMGLNHAREWISVEVPYALIGELTSKYAKDAEIKRLVDSRDIWIVPVVNPDGLVYSQTKSRMWRKNRRLNADKSYGVDLNRNYGYQWGNVGASNSTGSDTYHGTKAFSEPCTSAVKELAERMKFVSSVSFHSYSELVLYPFGYAYEATAKDDKLLAELAAGMAKLNGYTAEKSSDLYPAMGDSDDFMYGSMGALAFTIELGSQFVPQDSEVDQICSSNVKSCLYLLDRIGSVHASTHPDYASKVQVAISRYMYNAAVSNGKDIDSQNNLVNILNPSNDSEGKNFEEFMSEVAKSNAASKKTLAPVLKEVKNMYMNNVITKIGNTRQALNDIEKIQSELEQAENAK